MVHKRIAFDTIIPITYYSYEVFKLSETMKNVTPDNGGRRKSRRKSEKEGHIESFGTSRFKNLNHSACINMVL